MASGKKLERVVVATDFSEGANQAVQRALNLPLGPKAKLQMVHVVPDDVPGTLRDEAMADAARSLEKVLARFRPAAEKAGLTGKQVSAEVVEGDPARALLKKAMAFDADVVCVGRHGRRSIASLLVGSTARKVVKQAEVPVLLVQHPAPKPYDTVLVAVDLEKGSGKALRQSGIFAGEASTVEVLHATSMPYADYALSSMEEAEGARRASEEAALERLAELVDRSGLAQGAAKVLAGDARLLIAQEASRLSAEVVVVAAHGKKGVKRLLLGSVSDWLLSHALADVLVLRS